jgi:predicted Zn-dependent protease
LSFKLILFLRRTWPHFFRLGLGLSACALTAGLAWAQELIAPVQPSRSANALPALGDGSALSAAAERRLGDRIAVSLFRDPDYLDDPVLSDYLQSLWQPLMAAARARGELSEEIEERFAWRLLLVRDRSVNAFALPGGYLGVHTGLIGVVSSADELAAVLAHELSHVSQRHIARLTSQQQAQAPWLIGAMILGVLAASKNPDAANAAVVGGQALAVQGQLNFSRDMEREADRVGYGIMTEAGFDGQGAAGMFDKLQQASRLNDNGAFPYLRSHPLSTERMAEARARQQAGAGAHSNSSAREGAAQSRKPEAALLHHLMAARARVLGSPGVDVLRNMQQQASRDMAADPGGGPALAPFAGSLYAGALAASRLRESEMAAVFLTRLQAVVAGQPRAQDQVALLAMELALQAGKLPTVRLSTDAAKSRAGLLLQARADLASGDAARLAGSSERLQTWVAVHPKDATAWQTLAQVWGQQQQTVRAVRAEAEARVAWLDYPAALDRLRAAQALLRSAPASNDANTTIEASIVDTRTRQLTQLVREQALEDKLNR